MDLLHQTRGRAEGPAWRRLPRLDVGSTFYSIALSGQRFLFPRRVPTPRPHADLLSTDCKNFNKIYGKRRRGAIKGELKDKVAFKLDLSPVATVPRAHLDRGPRSRHFSFVLSLCLVARCVPWFLQNVIEMKHLGKIIRNHRN